MQYKANTLTVAKYRAAQAAVVELKGSDFAPQFRMLADADINLRVEEPEKDIAASLRGADGSRATRREPKPKKAGEKKKQKPISWIWLADAENHKAEMHDYELSRSHAFTHALTNSIVAVRVEWSKARARKTWWNEEVDARRNETCVALIALGRAYALRQVVIHQRIAASFYAEWQKTRDGSWANTEDMEFFIHAMDGMETAHEEGGDGSDEEESSREDDDNL
uniref:Uncharacterized protein n=1 Tax=Mycena chlorophos TaxID=658473 RepID=A0ABQ0KWN3_MYCCL|nr:predicted protein [Mycena chlorophos]